MIYKTIALVVLTFLASSCASEEIFRQNILPNSESNLSQNNASLHSAMANYPPQREVFPPLSEAEGGVINVKDYGAKGDGITDDTEAFKQAISRDEIANGSKIIYVPNGTYIVSDTIEWPKGAHGGLYYKRTTLLGETREGSIIRLKDNADNFSSGESKPILDTKDNRANAFRNRIENLTVHVGSGNKNAIGIKMNSNNGGGVFNVAIISGDGQGAQGLNLTSAEVGPLLIKNVSVEGFDQGILVGGGTTNSITMENITLTQQNKVGIEQVMQVLTIRNLKSINQVPALFIKNHGATLAVFGAELQGLGNRNQTAIITEYRQNGQATPGERRSINVFLSDIKQNGYQKTGEIYNCETGEQETLQGNIKEWSCGSPLRGFSTQTQMLNLPVEETPYIQHELNNIAVVEGNTGADIQAAIDTSGVKTVFLPNRFYEVSEPILIRGSVKKIIGMGARFSRDSIDPIFLFENGDEPIVVIERMEDLSIEHNAERTLVIKHAALKSYSNTNRGKGDVFFEDIVSGLTKIQDQKAWARSLNVEVVPPESEPKILNDGGELWILGLKTEKPGTILETRNNGSTVVQGGFTYINSDIPDTNPPQAQFINDNSSMAIVTRPYLPTATGYGVLVREIQGDTTQDVINSNRRTTERIFPYLGY
ncbi:glycoside hydrolase family 55 protein [Limnoraphis robusta Tam1]|uniref:Glycoside hydrolase family 55 protein n=1 Tax=Limnoraphis robusta CCNP1315 TaxID=3110306 RepID=A0ABU5TY38_9CYAN|nr:glycoside hydrolase family 55 protein [Limnoraphis robusta]MEA5497282.1 glycoside hydrolase family 55 protein [Limnoraphis robusta BA-68 BA1]MEA5519700.1 glycoside hydrolase family 55 protein [Limnoraphis robusta CCNP1315]MEA5540167.1 glycoside hydrolase family 55 protein [Limnoraphis robusta Tam1]MEA5544806.1 glycoside hydrolase family 55 protein [Limnoraphis robusta CCNP1324]